MQYAPFGKNCVRVLTNENFGVIMFSAQGVLGGVTVEKKLIYDDVSERIVDIAEQLAKENGARGITVRSILKKLGTTNRVFYNRYNNIDEVLELVYSRAVFRMHENTDVEFTDGFDFFGYVMEMAVGVLVKTYDIKMQFAEYMFEHDSLTQANCDKWMGKIKQLIEYATEKNLIKEVDSDDLSYSIWCFCRGFNADAVGRRLSKEDAVRCFRFGFGCFLDGLKK